MGTRSAEMSGKSCLVKFQSPFSSFVFLGGFHLSRFSCSVDVGEMYIVEVIFHAAV